MRRVLILLTGVILLLVIGTGIWIYRLEHSPAPDSAPLLPAIIAAETVEPAAAEIEEPATIPPEAVSFLDTDIDHTFFPLAGGHDLSCESCHTAGRFADTPTVCTACHEPPENHFSGECSACHVINDWTPFQFNHVGVTTCLECHEADAPANHYTGECAGCHLDTENWAVVAFNHSGFTDCAGCHTTDAPAGHFPGQCSNCHTSTDNWTAVAFNHSGFNDCVSCHSSAAPANHFPGQCSTCHSSNAWIPAEFTQHTFPLNHGSGSNLSCETCHTAAYTEYTCYNCHEHDPQEIREEHVEEGISDFVNCIECHPTGREEEFEND